MIHVFLFLPLVAAVLIAFLPRATRGNAAVVAALVNFGLGVYLWLGNVNGLSVTDWLPGFGVKYAVQLSGVSLLLSLVTSLMVPVGLYYLTTRDDGKLGGFYGLTLAMTTGLLGIFMARDLILFYVFFEATLIPSLFLLGRYGRSGRTAAATTMALYTVVSGLLMLAAIIGAKLLSNAPSFLFSDVATALRTASIPDVQFLFVTLNPRALLFFGFLVAFMVKLPLFPLHNWLPEFHAQNHPSGVADLMGTLYKVGGYGLFAVAIPLFPDAARDAQVIMMLLSAVTALYGAWIASSSRDFKRLLAYAGLSHMGFVGLGLFSLNPVGMSGAMYLLAFQGVYSSALFLIVGMLERRFVTVLQGDESHEKTLDEALTVGRIRGIAASAPAFAGVALTVWFASIGVPGLAGFIGEFSVLLGAYQAQPWLAALATATVIASAAFALTAYQRTWYEEATEGVPDLRATEWTVLAPVLAVTVLFGVYASPALQLIDSSIKDLTQKGVIAPITTSMSNNEVKR